MTHIVRQRGGGNKEMGPREWSQWWKRTEFKIEKKAILLWSEIEILLCGVGKNFFNNLWNRIWVELRQPHVQTLVQQVYHVMISSLSTPYLPVYTCHIWFFLVDHCLTSVNAKQTCQNKLKSQYHSQLAAKITRILKHTYIFHNFTCLHIASLYLLLLPCSVCSLQWHNNRGRFTTWNTLKVCVRFGQNFSVKHFKKWTNVINGIWRSNSLSCQWLLCSVLQRY